MNAKKFMISYPKKHMGGYRHFFKKDRFDDTFISSWNYHYNFLENFYIFTY